VIYLLDILCHHYY